ncbi:MAG TPA: magnesium/cobalt transporter CorA [Thermoleophilaceae bacterium]|jgi:magnesium transporter
MIIDCAVYEDGRRRDGQLELDHALEAAKGRDDAFVWIGLHEPSEEEFSAVAREFELHPLAVEDAILAHQRPKIETYGDTLFIVLKTARYVDPTEVITLGDIMLFVGQDFIVSVRHGEGSGLHEVRRRAEHDQDLLRCGPATILHAIVDHVVDDYFPAIDGVENDITEIEAQVFSSSRDNPAERIYKLKGEVLDFYRATAPLAEPLQKLARGDFDSLIHPQVQSYFRDVYDHLLRVIGTLDGYRDMLTSVLEANLTQISVRQNDDMRKISAWVAIAVVPTMIAGIYGMNFDHMPELRWRFGYPAVILLILLVCGTLYRYFKKVGWL